MNTVSILKEHEIEIKSKFHEDIFTRNVDLVTVDALKPQLKDDILQDVIYA